MSIFCGDTFTCIFLTLQVPISSIHTYTCILTSSDISIYICMYVCMHIAMHWPENPGISFSFLDNVYVDKIKMLYLLGARVHRYIYIYINEFVRLYIHIVVCIYSYECTPLQWPALHRCTGMNASEHF